MKKDVLIGGVTLAAFIALAAYFATRVDPAPTQTSILEYHKLPYAEGGMRVYVEEIGSTRELLLDTPTLRGVVVATTQATDEVTTNGQYGRILFSPTKRYLEYFLGFWEGGTAFVYDIEQKKNVLSIPMSGGFFAQDEKFYYTCHYTAFDGSGDASVYSVPSFKRIVSIFTQFPEILGGKNASNWNIVRCYEDGKQIVFDFGEYSGLGGEDLSGSEVDPTQVSVMQRFVFDRITGVAREVSL